MKTKSLLIRLIVMVTAIMSALGASAAEAEAYACYTSSNRTLTFYYDSSRSSRPGTTYTLNTGSSSPGWYSDGTSSSVTRVVFVPEFIDARPTTTCKWFSEMENLQTITSISNLNTSSVTNMGSMFSGCSSLINLDLSGFNTINVITMSYMFKGCKLLTSLDLSGFNTSNVIDMSGMMYGCSGLNSLKVESFNTSTVTSMWEMFYNCNGLTSIDLSSFNTINVTNMSSMFYRCSNLKTIYVGNSWSTSAITNSSNMFNNCSNLVGGMGTTYDANHVDHVYAHIDGGPSAPGYLSEKAPEAYACYTQSNSTLTFYYDNQRSSRLGTTYDLNTGYDWPAWNDDTYVTDVVFDLSFTNAHPTTTYSWFYEMENLQTVSGISNLNTSSVTNMASMFYGCSSLTSLNLSNFNSANVTDMWGMFYACNGLTTIYVGSEWNTAAVTSSDWMFYGCTSLVGGMGTVYDANHVDHAYAHIDGGPNAPGYLSEKASEAYACYTSANTTLTFYYDSQRSSRSGTTYDLNTENYTPDWGRNGTYANITHVVFDSSFSAARPTTTVDWFNSMHNLLSIKGMNYLNTSEVTLMNSMFYGCSRLTSLDLSYFNTANVTDMSNMFADCSGLINLNLSNFNTANVTDMWGMFSNCSGLINLDLSNFNTTNVTDMDWIFVGCSSLTSLDLSSFDTSNLTDMGAMFLFCSSLTSLDLSSFNTENVTNMQEMFEGCSSLKSLDLSSFNTANVIDMRWLFVECKSLTSIDLSNFNTENVTSMCGMFSDCSNLTSLDLSSFDTSKVTDMNGMFWNCSSLTSLDLSGFNTSKVTDMGCMFYGCSSLTSLNVKSFDTSLVKYTNRNDEEYKKIYGMFEGCTSLKSLDLSSFNTANMIDMDCMFSDCKNLTTIFAGTGWNTVAATSSNRMFSGCNNLVGGMGTVYDENHVDKTYAHIDGGTSDPGYFTDLNNNVAYTCYTPENATLTFYYDPLRYTHSGTTYDLNTGTNYPGWFSDGSCADVTKVVFDSLFVNACPTTTYSWFYNMENLQSFSGISYLNTSEVTNMAGMFRGCSVLSDLDLSSFNTENVTDMGRMFDGCYSLSSLDLGSFNTANAANMASMFRDCGDMASLNLSNFNTENVASMSSMFFNCSNLTSLDLSSFNTSKVENMASMFRGCRSLRTIFAGGEWTTAAVTSSNNMFQYCTSLVGGQGTTYNASYIDAAYAHLDGGPDNPGYFTELLRGDVNGSGSVTISDVSSIIDIMLGNAPANARADCNNDGSVTISDVAALIDYLLDGSW